MNFGRWEFALCLSFGMLTPIALFAITRNHPWSLLSIATFGMGLPLIQEVFKRNDPERLSFLFPKVGKLQILYTLLFTLGWVIG